MGAQYETRDIAGNRRIRAVGGEVGLVKGGRFFYNPLAVR